MTCPKCGCEIDSFAEVCPGCMTLPVAVALGKMGGSANTAAQNAARAENAKLGGWPKGRKRKAKKDN
jgi:hypothetical protein